ncbi:MAG: aminotransferase class I/II-fold pyridoxal phosphate-dependent enzyme [Methanomassiliicoccales archaeon]|nr:aminotransferase class I/II-fold pyridoxal phosphate-dependent enzyme [Methanomassiliicoccales archaeon]
MAESRRFKGRSTTAVHSGEPSPSRGEAVTPIFQTSTFYFPTEDPSTWEGKVPEGSYIYTRWGNPTIRAAEDKLAALEGSERGLLFSSGMAAITSAILSFVGKGDHIVSVEDIYGGTFSFLRSELPRMGVEVTFVDSTDTGAMERAIRPNTKLLYLESPTNPLLKLVDIRAAARVARAKGIKSLIDSTFATPINQRPIDLGVDLVAHSCTKYLNGHSDLIAGAVLGGKEDIEAISKRRILFGGSMDPLGAFLLIRGLKTLAVRMERHNLNGLRLAGFLESHRGVERVHYPGLSSHPQHSLAESQMSGFGGMVSFEVRGGRRAAERALRSFQVVKRATSLGGVDSLASMPLNSSHSSLSPQERERLGIHDQLIRLSAGIEDAEDLEDDLDQALS